MHAIAIERFGGAGELEPMELPDPKLGPDGILVRTAAAGVNPVDALIRRGALLAAFPTFLPVIPGWDVAGEVAAVGPSVREVAVGDRVIAYARKDFIQEGTYAELVALAPRHVAHAPQAVDLTAAAGLPLAGLTAYQALHDALDLRSGETILIHAGAGGVGSFAVQLARLLGAQVIATARARNHDYLRGLGAAECIDYTEGDVAGAVREAHPDGVDAVLDLVGGDTLTGSAQALREGGRLVSVIQPPDPAAFPGADVRYLFVRPNPDHLARLAVLVDAGDLAIHVEETFALDDAARAHERIEEGHVRGKLILRV